MQVSDKVMTAIGLMSDASLKGVDAALLRTDGMSVIEHGPVVHYPYPREAKVNIRRAMAAAVEVRDGADSVAKAVDEVTSAAIKATKRLMEKAYLTRDEIDVIGLHGHTLLHRPAPSKDVRGRTWQIGSGRILSDELRVDVVEDFRAEDIALGGQGTPFLPVYYAGLIKQFEQSEPVCVVTIDDVAHVTWVPPGSEPANIIGFDVGPGLGLIDEWVHFHNGEAGDHDGMLASAGKVDEEAVRLMALNAYVRRGIPKVLKGSEFKVTPAEHLEVEDGAATLTALTAELILRSESLMPEAPCGWIVCGAGRHNKFLMTDLQARLDVRVATAEEAEWRGDHLQAECFAYLAVRSLKQLPLSYPKTTRVPHPLTGGIYQRAPI